MLKIGAGRSESVVEALESLMVRAKAGELISIAYLAECTKMREPLAGVAGGYRNDPAKIVGELSIMKDVIARFAAQRRTAPNCFNCDSLA